MTRKSLNKTFRPQPVVVYLWCTDEMATREGKTSDEYPGFWFDC